MEAPRTVPALMNATAKIGSGANAQPDEAAVYASPKGRMVLLRDWSPPRCWRPPTAGPSPGSAALRAAPQAMGAEPGGSPTF
eukprot:8906498-Alexandrium_andersonii.AAC.1